MGQIGRQSPRPGRAMNTGCAVRRSVEVLIFCPSTTQRSRPCLAGQPVEVEDGGIVGQNLRFLVRIRVRARARNRV
jgi:hypothetical protein